MNSIRQDIIENHAGTLARAVDTATDIHGLGELSIDEAYAVQWLVVQHRLSKGEKLSGLKLGFTSRSKMEQMGVDSIIVGQLTDGMQLDPADPIALDGYIHPKLEPELVLHLARRVDYGPETTVAELAEDIRSSVDKVAVGMELIDSRYIDFKFTLTDVIADNTSAAGFLIGEWLDYPMELAGRSAEFLVKGELIHEASTDAILGNPENAFPELAKMVLSQGFLLEADSVILAGAMTPAVLVEPGQTFTARVAGFPELSARIAD
ncbi:2-keto-4-pentenoate hydratase [Corynebacterium sp. S7]